MDLLNINKILIIRLDEIGDVVMTSPLLRELRRKYPKANITLVVKPQLYNVVEFCPYVDEILVYKRDSKDAKKLDFFLQIYKTFVFSKKYLRKDIYDLAIVPRWDIDGYFASYLAYFSGAKRRIAYSENVNELKKIANQGYDGFFTEVIDDRTLKHEVERNLYFIEYLNGSVQNTNLEVWIDENDKKWVEEFLKNEKLDTTKILIAVFPSAGYRSKEWDVNKFVELINLLNGREKIKFVLLGDKKNTEKIGDIITKQCHDNIINYIGKTTIRQTIALLRRTDFYLGGDTGPMHLSVACGLKGVAIFSHAKDGDVNAISPERFGPWQNDMVVLRPERSLEGCSIECQKAYAHCINQITVDEVYKAFENILKGNS